MSLRQIAKELGISPAYLSYMLNGKRPWRKDLYQRYMGVVNTFVNSEGSGVNKDERVLVVAGAKIGAEDEIRTRDILLGKEVLYHCATSALYCSGLSTGSKILNGAEGQTRTVDTGIFSAVLYHLSYLGSSFYYQICAHRLSRR